MGWAKLDDRFHGHPKVLDAWRRCPASIGLHMLALSWVSAEGYGEMLNGDGEKHDGYVPQSFVALYMPDTNSRAKAVSALVECGLWDADEDAGWWVHDYLDYNPSSEERAAKRAATAERVRKHRAS